MTKDVNLSSSSKYQKSRVSNSKKVTFPSPKTEEEADGSLIGSVAVNYGQPKINVDDRAISQG